jgi:hypothetical protein
MLHLIEWVLEENDAMKPDNGIKEKCALAAITFFLTVFGIELTSTTEPPNIGH